MARRSETLGSGSTKKASYSSKAGLNFPVGTIRRNLRAGKYAKRVSISSSVYLAAVLEYLPAEVLELAGNAARDDNKGYIVSRDIDRAVKNDLLLGEVMSGIVR